MRKVFIYALCEPDSRTVRYIGKTVNLTRRFRDHVRESHKSKTYLGNWLKSVLGMGKVPNMVVLCETSEDLGSQEEIRYITAARAIGIRLTNATDGGEGMLNPSPETRARMGLAHRGNKYNLGRKLSLEHRAKISAAGVGRKRSAESQERINAANRGRRRSAEARARMSAAHKGKKLSEKQRAALVGRKLSLEHRAKMSEAQRGRKHSPETCAKISAAKMGNKCALGHKNSLGYRHSPEALAKMSAAHRGKKSSEKQRAARVGRKLSVEHRANISAARKLWWAQRKAASNG